MRPQKSGTFRAAATAVTAAFAMALAGCSSDAAPSGHTGASADSADSGDEASAPSDPSEILAELSKALAEAGVGDANDFDGGAGSDGNGDGSDGNGDGSNGDGFVSEVHPLVWHVPSEATTPAGYKQLPAACAAPEAEDLDRLTWISYAVPESWTVTSKGSGSDSPLTDTTTMIYYEGDGNSHKDYTVEFSIDNYEPDRDSPGAWIMVDGDHEPWQSFDYEHQLGDTVYPIHYDAVTTATVGDQEVEILKAPQAQAPEALSMTEYVARVSWAEVPTEPTYMAGQEPPWRPASSVLSIKYDAESDRAAPLTDDMVIDIISSIAMPACGQEYTLVMLEANMNADVNGDGHITTQQEMVEMMTGGR